MTITEIKVSEVPAGGKTHNSRIKASRAVIAQLVPGKAAKIVPDEGETLKGLRVSLTRASKALEVPVIVTVSEGALYVQLDETAK